MNFQVLFDENSSVIENSNTIICGFHGLGEVGWIACRHRVFRGLVSIVDGEYDNVRCSNELLPSGRLTRIGGPPQVKGIRGVIDVGGIEPRLAAAL